MKKALAKLESELMVLRRRTPFLPFAMKFKNGDTFKVLQPFQFAFARGENRGIFLHPKQGIVRFQLNEIEQLQIKQTRKK